MVNGDTIRDAILTCAQKPTKVSLIYRTKPTTKVEKKKKSKKDKIRSVGKESGESAESVLYDALDGTRNSKPMQLFRTIHFSSMMRT